MRNMTSLTSLLKINNKTFYLLIFVLFIGIFLRFYGISENTYWYDEVITLEVVKDSLHSIVTGVRPPLYLVIIKFWVETFGTSEFATRFLSIIIGISSIVLIYIIGRSLFNPDVGILSAFFMSVSKFQIYYSQELRYYSLFEFLTLTSFFFYWKFLTSRSYFYAFLYLISSILLYYSHDFGVFVIAAQNLYLLVKITVLRTFIVKWIIIQLLIFIGIAPRLVRSIFNLAIGEQVPNWIQSPSILTPLKTSCKYMGLHKGEGSELAVIAVFFLTCVTIYFFVIGKEKIMKSLHRLIAEFNIYKSMKNETILVILWFLVPITLALIMSKLFKPMYLDRYLICSAPAFYMIVALFITKTKELLSIPIILIAYVLLIAPGLYNYYTKPVREDWREVGKYIKNNDVGRTSVVLIPYINLRSFNWYNRGDYAYCSLPKGRIAFNDLFRICKIDDFDHFWVVRKKDEKYDLSDYKYKGDIYHVAKEKEFVVSTWSPITLYLFEKANE